MQLWFANKWNTLGAHRLLFMSFSLKNENNHHLMGVDKTMNLSCAGNWIKEIGEFPWNIAISISYKFSIYKTSDAFTWTRLFFGHLSETALRERRGRKVSKRVIHRHQSRVFPLSMCVMMTYLVFSIFHSIWWIRRALSLFYSRSNTEMWFMSYETGADFYYWLELFEIKCYRFQFDSTP
jgi:hypothetical protein